MTKMSFVYHLFIKVPQTLLLCGGKEVTIYYTFQCYMLEKVTLPYNNVIRNIFKIVNCSVSNLHDTSEN